MSVIVPAFNEEAFIGSSLASLHAFLVQRGWLGETEVIVVAADGGDRTADIARRAGSAFPRFTLVEPGPRAGKGRDVAAGFAAATGDFQLFTDADLATPLEHIDAMLELLEAGSDVVIGERDLGLIHKGRFRSRYSTGGNAIIRLLLLPGLRDTQCGFKGFTGRAARIIFPRLTVRGWGFDAEALTIARLHGLRIKPLPIADWKDPKGDHGLAGDSQWRANLATLAEVLRIRFHSWRGGYR